MVQTSKTVAIYARVSTDDQDCARQISDLTAFAERCGYKVVAVHQENASGAKNDRAERAKVLKLAQQKKIDAILVTELSRWGRSTEDLLKTLGELSARNVSVIAMSGMEFDLTTPTGKLMVTMLAGFAEFERALIQERVKSGVAVAKAKGVKFGRPGLSEKTKRQIVQLSVKGGSVRKIAAELKVSPTKVQEVVAEHRAGMALA